VAERTVPALHEHQVRVYPLLLDLLLLFLLFPRGILRIPTTTTTTTLAGGFLGFNLNGIGRETKTSSESASS
jgi:hypothetical protein